MATIDKYLKRWIELPDGRRFYGRDPGRSSVTLIEHVLRDKLARQVRGVTEAVLPYGRADVMTSTAVFEVEPATAWRNGIRQALSYSAQTGLPPNVALFGEARRDRVLKLYLRLRDGKPKIELWWWHTGIGWIAITSRAACRNMPQPDHDELPVSYDLAVL